MRVRARASTCERARACICARLAFLFVAPFGPTLQQYHHLYLISLSDTNSLWSLTSHGCAELPGASPTNRFLNLTRLDLTRAEPSRVDSGSRRPNAIIQTITLPLEWKAAGHPEARRAGGCDFFLVSVTARTDKEKSPARGTLSAIQTGDYSGRIPSSLVIPMMYRS